MARLLIMLAATVALSGCAGGLDGFFSQLNGQKVPEAAPVPPPPSAEEVEAQQLKDIRARMVARDPVGDAELGRLAGSGDGLAAYNLANRLAENGKGAAIPYYVQAARDGLTYAHLPMVKLVRREDIQISDSNLALARKTMERRADAGDVGTALTLVEVFEQGHPFGPDPEAADRYLTLAANNRDAGAALKLATRLLLDADDRAAGHPQARKYLEISASTQDLAARVTAENLLRNLGPVPIPAMQNADPDPLPLTEDRT